jgi:hypothetical protein
MNMTNILKTLEQLSEAYETFDIEVNGKLKQGVHKNYLKVLDDKKVKYKIVPKGKSQDTASSKLYKCNRCKKMVSDKNPCGCYD